MSISLLLVLLLFFFVFFVLSFIVLKCYQFLTKEEQPKNHSDRKKIIFFIPVSIGSIFIFSGVIFDYAYAFLIGFLIFKFIGAFSAAILASYLGVKSKLVPLEKGLKYTVFFSIPLFIFVIVTSL